LSNMATRVSRFAGFAIILSALAVACRTSDAPPRAGETVPETPAPVSEPQSDPEPPSSLIAESMVPRIAVFRRPGSGRPVHHFEHPDESGTPRVFLVREDAGDWLRVYLPMEPNESTGWVRTRDVSLSTTSYRLLVDTSRNRLTVFRGEREVAREAVAVGTGGTPTPTGHFFITMLVEPPDPGGAYGPYAYGLSAYSEVLNTFGGGDGQVAIHGTDDPSSLGGDVSHGCIRMDNGAITRLTRFLPLGTPVDIRA
jgi:lipoprotein-anchoring transpeptidase ErfK/SrfK